jgi:hypothetical protein
VLDRVHDVAVLKHHDVWDHRRVAEHEELGPGTGGERLLENEEGFMTLDKQSLPNPNMKLHGR